MSQLNLQPIASLFFGDGWNVGYSGNILADWKAPSGDVWTVPVGLGVGKVLRLGRLPLKVQLSLQYMPLLVWAIVEHCQATLGRRIDYKGVREGGQRGARHRERRGVPGE